MEDASKALVAVEFRCERLAMHAWKIIDVAKLLDTFEGLKYQLGMRRGIRRQKNAIQLRRQRKKIQLTSIYFDLLNRVWSRVWRFMHDTEQ